MAKRFSDTEIWKKQWFCDLSPTEKCFWRYLCDNCDNSGTWEINMPLAAFQIGSKINLSDIIKKFNGNIVKLSESKIYIVDFIKFQYGELKESCIPHKNVFALLEKHCIPYPYPIDRVMDKDKDKDKDKEIEFKRDYKGEKTWSTDYETYRKQCSDAFDKMIADWNFIKEKKEYYPQLNIRKSLEKMFFEYWEKEKLGWKNKKASKTENIDWVSTAENGLSMTCNQVKIPFYTRDEEKEYIEIMERRNAKKE